MSDGHSEPRVRLTTAQAIVRYLVAQRTTVDGATSPLFPGVFAIFGHGNVTCLGQALGGGRRRCRPGGVRTSRGWRWPRSATPRRCAAARSWWPRARSGPARPTWSPPPASPMANRLPVLLLAGDTFASRVPDPVLQQVEHFGDPDHHGQRRLQAGRPLLGPHHAARADHLVAARRRSRTMLDPATCGPAFLALPQDVQAEAFDFPERLLRPDRARGPATPSRRGATGPSRRGCLPPPKTADHRRRRRALLAAPRPSWPPSPRRHNIPVVETMAGKASLVAGPPDERRPDRRHRCAIGQRARRRGRRDRGHRHAAAGLHHRLVDGASRDDAPLHRHQRRALRRHQAPGRCPWSAMRGKRLAELVRRRLGRLARHRRASGPSGPGTRRGLPRLHRQDRRARRTSGAPSYAQVVGAVDRIGPARRLRAHRGRRLAGRAEERVAGQGPRHLRLRVRLLVHGLRDRRRVGRQDGP